MSTSHFSGEMLALAKQGLEQARAFDGGSLDMAYVEGSLLLHVMVQPRFLRRPLITVTVEQIDAKAEGKR